MRILCPTDGSVGAAAARDKLIASLAPEGVVIDLLLVLPAASVTSTAAERPALTPEDAELAADRAGLDAAGFRVRTSLRIGHPAEEIVARAEEDQPDLLILGARQPGDGSHGFPGRVASKVAHHSPTSVLIARDGLPVRSIVLGYDASPDADAALSLLCRLPFCAAPEVVICTAFEVATPFPSGPAPRFSGQLAVSHHEDYVEARLAAEAIAGFARARLHEAHMRATVHAAHGRASEQLNLTAKQVGADLIVVGSRALAGVERFMLGSTGGELASLAPTSLLVARS